MRPSFSCCRYSKRLIKKVELRTALSPDNDTDVSSDILKLQFKCYKCLTKVSSNDVRNEHLKTYSTECPSKALKNNDTKRRISCELCGETFALKNSLTRYLKEKICVRRTSVGGKKNDVRPVTVDTSNEVCKENVKTLKIAPLPTASVEDVRNEDVVKCPPVASVENSSEDVRNEDVALDIVKCPPAATRAGDMSCELCGRTFAQKGSLTRHLKEQICTKKPTLRRSDRNSGKVGQCHVCDKTFVDIYSVGRHLREVHKMGTSKDKKDTFFDDRKVIENGEEVWKCEHCPYKTPKKHRFHDHYRRHTGERPYQCDHCGKTFRTRAYIQKHVLTVHEGVKKYPCDICGRSFSDRRFMLNHRYIHTGDKPYVCDICGKAYRQSSTLMVHKKFHLNVRDYECSLCAMKFVRRGHLTMHIKRHNNIRDFVCTQCGKGFVDRKMLRDHETVHSDNRPFSCDICGGRFKLKKHLRQHDRTHRLK